MTARESGMTAGGEEEEERRNEYHISGSMAYDDSQVEHIVW